MARRNSLLAAVVVAALSTVAHAAVYDASRNVSWLGTLNQRNGIVNYSWIACGPASGANALAYLQNSHPGIYGTPLVSSTSDVAAMSALANTFEDRAYMNLRADGVPADSFIWGMQHYMDTHAPGKTTFSAMNEYYFTYANTGQAQTPSYLTAGTLPTWDFLYQKMQEADVVEAMFRWSSGGHFVVVSAVHWSDDDTDGMIDMGEGYIKFIDSDGGCIRQLNMYQSGSKLYIDGLYGRTGPNAAWLSMVDAQTAVPEPASMTFLVLGAACLLRRKR